VSRACPSSGRFFNMSVVAPDIPRALLFFNFFRASLTSARDGRLSRVEVIGLWLIWLITVGSI